MMYGSLDIRCNVQSFLGTVFYPLDPPPLETWKIKSLIKLKKIFPEDIVIWTINA